MPSLMTIGSGILVILRVLPRDLQRLVTGEKDSLNTQLKWPRWHDIHTKSHYDRLRNLSDIKGNASTI